MECLRKFSKRLSILLLFLIFVYIMIPLPSPLFQDDHSTVFLDEEGNILRAFLNSNQQWHFPTEKGIKIPEKLKKAVIHFEDQYFHEHPGFNPLSIARALFQNLSSGRTKSGASTLSMQVIRLAYKKKRTLWNKFIEILQATKLETKYSKEQILKMYLNNAPYGGNIIGYYAASLKYFKKKPAQLTWSQAATLAVLPNSPGLISPAINRDKLITKRNGLLKSLYKKNVFDRETYSVSIQEPLPRNFKPFFVYAPHLAQTLKNKFHLHSGFVRTTLIKSFQARVESMLEQHLKYLNPTGIKNGAAILVETKTGKIRAYAGSQDFFDKDNSGQVDGVISPRSTGSILKPFLYALSMDEGLILPRTLIRDIPSYFGSFSPSNADKKYSGLVTAREALIRSLNVPAVRLLNAYGLYKFYVFLKSAGMSTIFRKPDEYGLTIIIGGAEATLYDLAKLYAGLGNYGKFKPLMILYNYSDPLLREENQLISPEACYLTLNILKEVKRPGSEYYWDQYQNQYPIAWKTVTSYGQRDAWAIGVTPEWTIAVWIGNFTGEGNTNLSGAKCAAPLMFDIFNLIPKTQKNNWFSRAEINLYSIKICMDTGFAAGPNCERIAISDSPRGLKPLRTCPFHKKIYVTLDEKFRVCSMCWEPGKYKSIKRLFLTPDVAQYLRESGIILSHIPQHKKNCPGFTGTNPVKITYPVQNAKLWIPRDFDGKIQKITFNVAHRYSNRKVYWYLDNIYRGFTQDKHKMVFLLNKGWHRIEVVDEEGNRDWRRFHTSSSSD